MQRLAVARRRRQLRDLVIYNNNMVYALTSSANFLSTSTSKISSVLIKNVEDYQIGFLFL